MAFDVFYNSMLIIPVLLAITQTGLPRASADTSSSLPFNKPPFSYMTHNRSRSDALGKYINRHSAV